MTVDPGQQGPRRQILSHDPRPGYMTVFLIVFALGVLYLVLVFALGIGAH